MFSTRSTASRLPSTPTGTTSASSCRSDGATSAASAALWSGDIDVCDKCAEPYVTPPNRLDPHTSAFAADQTRCANTRPTVWLRDIRSRTAVTWGRTERYAAVKAPADLARMSRVQGSRDGWRRVT